jgi:putative cardiolipin synthase
MTTRPTHRMPLLFSLLLALLLGACANLPDLPAAAPATAKQAPQDTTLARIASESTPPAKRHLSGLRLLPAGDHAFDARLALARHAERALDLSPHTVKRHVANILDKLALQTRGQAAAWFRARR